MLRTIPNDKVAFAVLFTGRKLSYLQMVVDVEKGLKYLTDYSNRRLSGEHVPYAVEAYPEGNQRHLSAESALYCRVITEGIFGFRPIGLNAFSINPQLPASWKEMSLRNIIAFDGKTIDITVAQEGKKISVIISLNGKQLKKSVIDNGTRIDIKL